MVEAQRPSDRSYAKYRRRSRCKVRRERDSRPRVEKNSFWNNDLGWARDLSFVRPDDSLGHRCDLRLVAHCIAIGEHLLRVHRDERLYRHRVRKELEQMFKDIRQGSFAKKLAAETESGFSDTNEAMDRLSESDVELIGRAVRRRLEGKED